MSKRRINWSSYKIRQNQDKVGVFVSLVSTKVPFKGTGKEYIGDDIPEVQAAVKRAIEKCCLQLKAKLIKQRALADDKERRKNLTKYIPDVSKAIHTMLAMAADPAAPVASDSGGAAGGSAAGKRPRPAEHEALLDDVRAKKLQVETLADKLRLHVEQCDVTAALETVTAAGMLRARQELYLCPFDDTAPRMAELHHPHFVLRLQQRCVVDS